MALDHPLARHLASSPQCCPSFAYLHHPYHSSDQCLPPSLGSSSTIGARKRKRDSGTVIPSESTNGQMVARDEFVTVVDPLDLNESGSDPEEPIYFAFPTPDASPKDGSHISAPRLYTLIARQVQAQLRGSFALKMLPNDKGKERAVNGHLKGLSDQPMKPIYRFDGLVRALDQLVPDGKHLSLVFLNAQTLPKILTGTGSTNSLTALTRLGEYTKCSLSIVLASRVAWDELRPFGGDAIEPLHLFLPQVGRALVERSLDAFSSHPLHHHFVQLLLASSFSLVSCDVLSELWNLAEVLWPIYTAGLPPHAEASLLPNQPILTSPEPLKISYQLLTDLKNQSAPAFAAAIDHLLTHNISTEQFLETFLPKPRAAALPKPLNDSERAFFDLIPSTAASSLVTKAAGPSPFLSTGEKPRMPRPEIPRLPVVTRFLLIAAFCASYNSSKSDLRMFGRGPLANRARQRVRADDGASGYQGGGSTGKQVGAGLKKNAAKLGKVGRVPQYLLGPRSFPLDRLLAIFQAIVVEHGRDLLEQLLGDDTDSEEESDDTTLNSPSKRNGLNFEDVGVEAKRRAKREREREMQRTSEWEDDVEELSRSVGLFGMIPELENLRLLCRVSPRDRLDNIVLRCEASREMVDEYAKSLKVDLQTYLTDG